ncbi:tetratricopeptide repeat protein [Kaarinaea lacus]
MNKEVFVFEVSEKSFNRSVILNSNKIPVLVEFMGIWSEPCVLMADLFADLAKEFAEQFIFAKVDIDEQPALREQYEIQNVPTLITFKDGQIIRNEVGQLQEKVARRLLKELGIFRESDAMREEAREQHLSGDTSSAVLLLTEAIQKDPGNTRIAMDMVQIFIDLGQIEDARGLFNRLPEQDKNTETGRALTGQLLFLELAGKTEGLEKLTQCIREDTSNHSARFDLAICQVAKHQYRDAMNNLLFIQKAEPNFKEGAAQELIVTLANMLSPVDPALAQDYRRKLANLLAE